MIERRRMISEAAKELGLETYHLRTWEEEFGLCVPRNEKGYRSYGEKELKIFQGIRDMRRQGLSLDVIKGKMQRSPMNLAKAKSANKEKMEQFGQIIIKLVGQAVAREKDVIGRSVGHQVTEALKEQLEQKERLQKKWNDQLDHILKMQERTYKELEMEKGRRRFFHFGHRR